MAGASPAGASQSLSALAPGLALAIALALGASLLEPLVGRLVPLPALVIALIVGIWLHPLALRGPVAPGLRFCVSRVLRVAVALLGLRVSLGDIAALGPATAVIVILAMATTIFAGIGVARALGLSSAYGVLAGTATAVCGASAALATSSVLPPYPAKDADTVFVIVAVNLLSTVAMLVYAPAGHALGFGDQTVGVLIGGAIHDVAQVVGAGYAVSDSAGAAAVIVKLFRVLLLLPVILAIGFFFSRQTQGAKAPLPVFAFAFLALCILNSIAPSVPMLAGPFATFKAAAGFVSTWGLLVAIAALGLGTSVTAITRLGWRHVATVLCATLVIFAVVAGGLVLTT
ncbi:MAG: hypothetical protein JWN07_2969 [Hyphomicrobiales bacterium]|nr:hypothetical protein [Hyphomicrobiales bacterium]